MLDRIYNDNETEIMRKNSLNYDDEIHHTVNSYIIPNGGHSFPFFSFPYEL